MIITWSPDTCLCILAFDFRGDQIIYSSHIQKCRIHNNLFDQSYLDAVMAHCRSYQIRQNATETERRQNSIDKANEKKRIRDLGDPIRDV